MFLRLVEAISLHRKGLLHGAELFIFPADVNPWVFSTDLVNEAKSFRLTNNKLLERVH